MVKLDQFNIVYNNPEEAYFAGQEISGKIIIKNSEEKEINEILLEIKGRAKTYWTKHSGKSRRHCSCSEPYFCEQFNTFYTQKLDLNTVDTNVINQKVSKREEENIPSTSKGKPTNDLAKNKPIQKQRKLPAGVHEIPFSYTLPKTLPSSFEGEFGFVRYTCRAICERPWDFDICTRHAFTVVGIEDINEESEILRPASKLANFHQKQFWCLNQGKVALELSIPCSGYTPGEAIIVNGKIENNSRKVIRSSCLKLCQQVKYKAKTFAGAELIKNISRVVAKLEKGEIGAGLQCILKNEKLFVPAVPSRLSKCKIIQITYALELEVSTNSKISLPIVIGTIPLLSEIVKKMCSSAANKKKIDIQNESILKNVDSNVQVTITDESGQTATVLTDDDKLMFDNFKINKGKPNSKSFLQNQKNKINEEENKALFNAKKRVRMPSSILSELYPILPSPYYKESCFGRVCISDKKEQNQFGENFFAPKYPFYAED